MFARWILPKAGKKAVQTIKSVRPGSDTGAKSKQYFQNKAFLFSLLCFPSGILELANSGRHLGFTINPPIFSFVFLLFF